MNKASILNAPSWAHMGEYIASGTIYQMAGCVETTAETTSSEAVVYLQNKRKLKQISTAAEAQDQTKPIFLGYKWPTEDDYLRRNSLTELYSTSGEGVVGLRMIPGVRIQEYVGTDYTNSSGVKLGGMAPAITWANVTYGTRLYFTNSGQLTTATTNKVVRAIFIEYKSGWVTYEIITPYPL